MMKYSPSEFHDSSRWRLMFLCSRCISLLGLTKLLEPTMEFIQSDIFLVEVCC